VTVERRLSEALSAFDRVEPSPDLFARVERSLAEDLAHRRRIRRWALAAAGSLAVAATAVAGLSSVSSEGRVVAPAWGIRAVEFAVLIGLTVVLGPAIRRFGSLFVEDVFRLSPDTGTRFLKLIDVAYYLVFLGYALAGVVLQSAGRELLLASLLGTLFDRVGGLLLMMGLLHATTIAVLPVIGLLHASIVRRHRRAALGASAPPPSARAQQAERVVRLMLWLVVAAVVVQVLVGIGVVVGIGIAG
jgi:hypothetical protein